MTNHSIAGSTPVRLVPEEDARILIIRRDNIGDLLCTTPMIRALRQRYPGAWIGALVNSYTAPVLAGNRDLNQVYAYEKLKHLSVGRSRLGALFDRLQLIRELRGRRIDYVILPASGRQASALRLARLVAPRRVIGRGNTECDAIDIAVATDTVRQPHEAQACFGLLQVFGIDGMPPPMSLAVDATALADVKRQPGWAAFNDTRGPVIGLHISARKPQQRWPIDRYSEFARHLHAASGARFLLFWAPGSSDNQLHPGDDQSARALADALSDVPVFPVKTERLPELIAGLSLCDQVVCSDGGAMHIAAALGKPIVCFFGNSDAARWHPWATDHRLLQAPSRKVADISVEEVLLASEKLMRP